LERLDERREARPEDQADDRPEHTRFEQARGSRIRRRARGADDPRLRPFRRVHEHVRALGFESRALLREEVARSGGGVTLRPAGQSLCGQRVHLRVECRDLPVEGADAVVEVAHDLVELAVADAEPGPDHLQRERVRHVRRDLAVSVRDLELENA
jgi:hypothetical protein